MSMESAAKPVAPSPEFQEDQMVRLSRRLWWMPPKGTMQRAYEGCRYFKNGGRGFTMEDLDE
ncbi:MAG: hypothetical protein OXI51_07090 [Chloroflexota bacterium]|nr:hypothetical protein [Chloroflexota bacterium]